jgi:hypothetical protein
MSTGAVGSAAGFVRLGGRGEGSRRTYCPTRLRSRLGLCGVWCAGGSSPAYSGSSGEGRFVIETSSSATASSTKPDSLPNDY